MNPAPPKAPLRPVMAASGMILLLVGIVVVAVRAKPPAPESRFGPVIHEARSDFSDIRVRGKGTLRALLFVDEAGNEACQSALDLADPAGLPLGYTRGMFASLAYGELPSRVLIVGLGGGGMVRYLEKTLPDVRVEAVEIDPEVVRIAGEFFGIRESDRVIVHTADAFGFFTEDHGPYDHIYMDAFLRAPEVSGLNEKARRLKTADFLSQVKARLAPGGIIVFNLIGWDQRTPEDLASIGAVFPGLVRYPVPATGNLIVVAPREGAAPDARALERRAAELDASLALGFSLREVVGWADR